MNCEDRAPWRAIIDSCSGCLLDNLENPLEGDSRLDMEDTIDDFQLQIDTDPCQYLRIVTDSVLSDYLWIVTPGISLRLLGDDYGEGRL